MEAERGFWNGAKQLAEVVSSVCAGKATVSLSDLERILNVNKPKFISLLKNPPKDSSSRQRIRSAQSVPVSLLGSIMTLPQEVIEEAIVLSDMCELNEEVAAELLILAESQGSSFPTVPRGLVAVLLYYDAWQSIVSALQSIAEAIPGKTWTLDIKPEASQLLIQLMESLLREHDIVGQVLVKLRAWDLEKEMSKLERNRALGSRLHRGQIASLFLTTRMALAKVVLALSAQQGLRTGDLLHLIRHLSTLDLSATPDGTLDHVSLLLFSAALMSLDSSPLRDQPGTGITEHLPLAADPDFIPQVHEAITGMNDIGSWKSPSMKSCLQFAWAVSLRILGQFQDNETCVLFAEEDEALLDLSFVGHPFRFLSNAVVSSAALSKEEFCFRRLHGLFVDFLMGLPLKVKEIRNRADEGARLAAAHLQHGLDAPRNLPHEFSDLLVLLAKMYSQDSWGLKLDYWCPVETSSANFTFTPTLTTSASPKQVALFKFLRVAGDLLPSSLYSLYLDFLTALSDSPDTCIPAFSLLRASAATGRIVSLDHFFTAFHQYYKSLRLDQPSQAGDTIYRPAVPRGISPVELRGLSSALKLISVIARNNAFIARGIFGNPTWQPIQILIGLVECPVPTAFKGHLLDTLTSFVEGCPELAHSVWTCVEAAQILQCIPTVSKFAPGGIKVELQEVEVRNEEYPFTLAFVRLLKSLVTACHKPGIGGLPVSIGLGRRSPGIEPYVEFVLNSVFLSFPTWGYKDSKQMWEIGLVCLEFFNSVLISYTPDPSHFHQSASATASAGIHPGFHLTALLLTPGDVARMILRLLDDCVAQLELIRGPFLGNPVISALVQRATLEILRLLNRLMQLQGPYLSLLRETGSALLLCTLDKILLCSNPQTGRNDHPMSLLKLVPLHASHAEAAALSISIMDALLGPSGTHLLALLNEDPVQASLIRHGFVECIENQSELSAAAEDCRRGALQLLVHGVEKSDGGGWGLALYLLGFDLKRPIRTAVLQDTTAPGISRSCLHAVVSSLAPTDKNPNVPTILGSPEAAVLSYRLLHRLMAHQTTTAPVGHFLRNERQFFLQQLGMIPFRGSHVEGDQVLNMHVSSWLMRLIAHELRACSTSPQFIRSAYLRKLIGLLIGSGDEKGGASLAPSLALGAAAGLSSTTVSVFGGGAMTKRRLLSLISDLDLGEPEMPALRMELFNTKLIQEMLENAEGGERDEKTEHLVDLKLLHDQLATEIERAKNQGVGPEEMLAQEAESVLQYAFEMNVRMQRVSGKTAFIESWSQMTEVLFSLCPQALLKGEVGQQVLVDAFHELTSKLLSPTTVTSLLSPISRILFILVVTLRDMITSDREEEELRRELRREGAGADTHCSSWLTLSGKNIIAGMLGKLLDCMSKFRSSRQWVQVQLYSCLLSLLQAHPREKLWGQTVVEHEALEILCRDALLGHNAVSLQATQAITLLIVPGSPALEYVTTASFLQEFKAGLLRDDVRTTSAPTIEDATVALQVLQFKLKLLEAVAMCSFSAARSLLEQGLMTTLSEMEIWRDDRLRAIPAQLRQKEESPLSLNRQAFSSLLELMCCLSSALGAEYQSWVSQVTFVLLSHMGSVLSIMKKCQRETLMTTTQEGEEVVLLTRLIAQLGALLSPSVEDVSGLDLRAKLDHLASSVLSLLSRLSLDLRAALNDVGLHTTKEFCEKRNNLYEVIDNLLTFCDNACKGDPCSRRGNAFVCLFAPTWDPIPSGSTSSNPKPAGAAPSLSVLVSLLKNAAQGEKLAALEANSLKEKLAAVERMGTEELKTLCSPLDPIDSLRLEASTNLRDALSWLEVEESVLERIKEKAAFILFRHLEWFLIALQASSQKSYFTHSADSHSVSPDVEQSIEKLKTSLSTVFTAQFFTELEGTARSDPRRGGPSFFEAILRGMKHLSYVQI